MTATDAIILPAGTGDEVVRNDLSYARNFANLARSKGWAVREAHVHGILQSEINVARSRLRANVERAMAAENEIRFLLGLYLTHPRGRWAALETLGSDGP